jgi:ATP diphosphatase
VGFDWTLASDVVAKIEEEVGELREAVEHAAIGDGSAKSARAAAHVEEEMGDLLFAIANLSRQLGVEPEGALRKANEKFSARFAAMEKRVLDSGRSMEALTLDELESEWQRVKGDSRAQDRG